MINFAEYLVRKREEQNITMAELGRRSGISRGYLHALENGGSDPTLATLEKIAEAFGLPVGSMLLEAEDCSLPNGNHDTTITIRLTSSSQIWLLGKPEIGRD